MIILKQYFDKYKEVIDGAVDQDIIQSCTEMIHTSNQLTAEEKKELLLQCQSKSKEILRSKITFWMPTQKLKEILKATLLLTVITTCGQGTMIVSFNNHSTDTRINPFNLRNLFSKPISSFITPRARPPLRKRTGISPENNNVLGDTLFPSISLNPDHWSL